MFKPPFVSSGHHSFGMRRQSGFSLIELMVASALSLIILAGLLAVFVNTSRARAEVDRAGQQIENGQYAMQLLSSDLRNAGYLAEFDPRILPTPAAKPNPCATLLDDLKTALPLHIQGYDNASTVPTCLTDVRSNTDILVVRRASTCFAGAVNCEPVVNGNVYFQASLCNSATELASANKSDYYGLDSSVNNLTRTRKDCSTLASIARYRTHIYFVANNNKSGDGIPTLKRAELGVDGFTIVPLVQGIENLQVEYGIDTSGNGVPGVYTADPDTYNTCDVSKTCVQNWRNVISAKVYILVRSNDMTPGYTNSKTYTLGRTASGLNNNIVINGDHFKRHVFQSSIRLNNPAARNSTP